jgi:hypothetical protein
MWGYRLYSVEGHGVNRCAFFILAFLNKPRTLSTMTVVFLRKFFKSEITLLWLNEHSSTVTYNTVLYIKLYSFWLYFSSLFSPPYPPPSLHLPLLLSCFLYCSSSSSPPLSDDEYWLSDDKLMVSD